MKKIVAYFIFPMMVFSWVGCVSSGSGGSNPNANQSSSEAAVVKEIFLEWKEDILQDRWDKAYALTSQAVKAQYGNDFATWKLDFQASVIKDYLKNVVEVKQVAIGDDGMATIAIETRDKTRVLWTAANEMGSWRIEKVIPPR